MMNFNQTLYVLLTKLKFSTAKFTVNIREFFDIFYP